MTSRTAALIFSILLLIAFIMPWFIPYGGKPFDTKHLLPRDSNVTGYEVHKFGHVLAVMERGRLVGTLTQQKTPFALYLVYLMPVLWALNLVMSLIGIGRRVLYVIAGALPLAGLAALLALYGTGAFNYITFGAYLCALGGAGMLVAAVVPAKKAKS